MKRTIPFAAFLGLAPRKKPRTVSKPKHCGREVKRVESKGETVTQPAKVRTMKPKEARHAHEIERHTLARMKREDAALNTPFAQLLRAGSDESDPDAIEDSLSERRRAARPIFSNRNAGKSRRSLTPTARRIIALGAECRGEALQEADIEERMRQDRDRALGFTPEVRAIIDRASARHKTR